MKYTHLICLALTVWSSYPSCVPQRSADACCEERDTNAAEVKALARRNYELQDSLTRLTQQLALAFSPAGRYVSPGLLPSACQDSLERYRSELEGVSEHIEQLLGAYRQKALLADSLETAARLEREAAFAARANFREMLPLLSNQGVRMRHLAHTYDIFVADLQAGDLSLHWRSRQQQIYRSLDRLKADLEASGKRLVFATNAGMYTPENFPQGLYIERGKKMIPADTKKKGYGNFYLQPNGVFMIDSSGTAQVLTTEAFAKVPAALISHATQSGPMLLINGQIHPRFNQGSPNLHIRSGVGITAENKVVFAISNQQVNFYEFASLFRDYLGCKNALYLDGAISRMYLPQIGRTQLGGNFGPMIALTEKDEPYNR